MNTRDMEERTSDPICDAVLNGGERSLNRARALAQPVACAGETKSDGPDETPAGAVVAETSGVTAGETAPAPPNGKTYSIAHDAFTGTVQGHYVTREGKRGVVLQQIGTRVVHVCGEKWLIEPDAKEPG